MIDWNGIPRADWQARLADDQQNEVIISEIRDLWWDRTGATHRFVFRFRANNEQTLRHWIDCSWVCDNSHFLTFHWKTDRMRQIDRVSLFTYSVEDWSESGGMISVRLVARGDVVTFGVIS